MTTTPAPTLTWQNEIAEIWELFKETDARFKETDARIAENNARLDARIAATDARIKELSAETDQKINKLAGTFGQQWGRLVEVLIQLDVVRLFQERNIKIKYVTNRIKRKLDGETIELDLLLLNSHELVVVETKSRFQVEDVNDFLTDLTDFDRFFPEYRAYQRYGAVAALEFERDVSRYAYRKGLFVLAITGQELVEIKNSDKFRPYNFGAKTETIVASEQ